MPAAASMRTSMRTSPRLTWRGAPQLKPHYMAGGTPGDLKGLKNFWDPVGFTNKLSAEKLQRQRLAELKNGRLAMLGITSVLIAHNLPGSIPVPIDFPAGPSVVLPF